MGAFWVKRAAQWYYSAANLIRTRSTSDRTALGGTDQGATDATLLSVDGGSEGVRAIVARGIIHGSAVLVNELGSNLTCAYLTSTSGTIDRAGIYVRNNQLVIAHQCGANGQIRYLTITLDGLSCAWVQSATAP